MNLDLYYNNLSMRLFGLIILSLILSWVYLKYLKRADEHSFLKQEKAVYLLQIIFWVVFIGNFFGIFLPSNVIGFFIFEFILLTIIFLSFTFVVWKIFNKKKFDFGIFFISLPLILLFVVALGMT